MVRWRFSVLYDLPSMKLTRPSGRIDLRIWAGVGRSTVSTTGATDPEAIEFNAPWMLAIRLGNSAEGSELLET